MPMNDENGPSAAPRGDNPALGSIVVIDDEAASAITLEETCAAVPGVSVLRASSALEAIRILEDQARPICAVVTDIRMPGMDGFELIRFIRAHRGHAETPIVVVTADTDPDTPVRALKLGVNACFSKPFSPRAVRRTLEELLNAKSKVKPEP